jgi:dienelactone hydrolase
MNKWSICGFGFLLCLLVLAGCAGSPGSTDEYQFSEETISIPHGDHEIPAVLTLPEGAGKFPAVVMLHGYGSNKDEAGNGYKLIAAELAKKGIASLRIDFMGNGDSKADFVDFDPDKGASDADAAAAYLVSRKTINPGKIGIMGWSMGGGIAALSAGRNGIFKSLVTWAGAPDLTGVFDDEGYEEAKKNGFVTATFDWRPPLNLGLAAYEGARNIRILEELSKSTAPVLAINGSEDTVVPPETAGAIAAASKNKESKAVIIDGADHTFNIFSGDLRAFNELSDVTIGWFLSTL